MRSEEELRTQLAWALGMWRKHGHQYDAGYVDAIAWALGEASPSRAKEGLEKP
ncbi:MAG TPA: hypothetical protein VGR28_12220 [Candidatus Thermoplasmatota archaeon]|jgi:hypothetical protein|nr:hypothetical protein [Candidatus Thermoplasmatota archaeon]